MHRHLPRHLHPQHTTNKTTFLLFSAITALTVSHCCRYLFSQNGIRACGYDTTQAGVYTIVFSVTNSQGMSASVTRTLAVQPICTSGETLCSNQVSPCCCSTMLSACQHHMLKAGVTSWQPAVVVMVPFSVSPTHCSSALDLLVHIAWLAQPCCCNGIDYMT